MKLLDWMHHKFRHNSREPFKDLPSGLTCNCLSAGASHHKLSPIVSGRIHGNPMEDRLVSLDEPLIFEGLLSIGTLGSSLIDEEENQEMLHEVEFQELTLIAVEKLANKEESDTATEADLVMVNTELEKVLTEAAQNENDNRLSSARPSIVSSMGKAANEACPLQEFLFAGSTIERTTDKEGKKKRVSLGELFMIEEGGGRGGGDENRNNEFNMTMNKMFKRRGSHTSSFVKLQKIMQIFHRKVHPEDNMTSKKNIKSGKNKNKYINYCFYGGDDILMTSPEQTYTNEDKHGLDQTSLLQNESESASSREHWIKTDANYLVLEL